MSSDRCVVVLDKLLYITVKTAFGISTELKKTGSKFNSILCQQDLSASSGIAADQNSSVTDISAILSELSVGDRR